SSRQRRRRAARCPRQRRGRSGRAASPGAARRRAPRRRTSRGSPASPPRLVRPAARSRDGAPGRFPLGGCEELAEAAPHRPRADERVVGAPRERRPERGRDVALDLDLVGNERPVAVGAVGIALGLARAPGWATLEVQDRKSTRLNSSHVAISYAVFCLKKKKKKEKEKKRKNNEQKQNMK